MQNHALKYLKLGFSVIPLEPKGKKPLIPWQEFQKRRASESEVREWFKKWPDANLGIVTGSISGLAVIDLDGPEGLASALSLGLQSNVVSLTGEGKHLWYRHPGVTVANAVRSFPGVDLRGDGGFVVAPPSVHESGRRYRWLQPFTRFQVSNMSSFPTELIRSLKPTTNQVDLNKKEESWSKASLGDEVINESYRKPRLDIAKALQEMKNGNIDDTLFSICSRLRSDGYTSDDARVLLGPHADKADATPGHLDEKIRNVWSRYEARPKTSLEPIHSQSLWRQDSQSENRRYQSDSRLVIHSPSNPDSLKQFERLQLRNSDDNTPILGTGYSKLDQMFQGGLKSSRLFTVAARTGVGKTNWLLGAVRTLCDSGQSVLLFSTEMPYAEIWERYIASLQNPGDFQRHKFYVCDSFAPNLERVEEAINEIKPDVFMFDHINHVSEEQRELGAFMQGLNFLRRKYECAGIVTAQLNRSADWVDLKTGEKVTPRMSMIKGSGTIEQASSRVLLLSETRITPEGTEIVGNLDKNDNGPKGLLHFMLKSNPYRMEEI